MEDYGWITINCQLIGINTEEGEMAVALRGAISNDGHGTPSQQHDITLADITA
jgi:hypothetical protein